MTNRGDEFGDRLCDWLDQELVSGDGPAASEDACQRAADEILVHGLLRDHQRRDPACEEQRIKAVMSAIDAEPQHDTAQTEMVSPGKRLRRVTFVSAVAAMAAGLLLVFTFSSHHHADAALVSLDRIIEASKRSFDRSYRIYVVEQYSNGRWPRHHPPINRRRNQDQIDGAVLHVRGPKEFVFVRRLSDGQQRTSGCNGRESWAFRENSPIHVSSDLTRFHGGLPGQKQDLPFVNLNTNLQQLTAGYDIELSDQTVVSSDGRTLSVLVATRKSMDINGPVYVAVWFDANTGVIFQMLLDRLPRRGGGPKSVRLELLNPEDLGQTDFGPDFFSHDSHHEPFREVRYEDAR